MLCILINAGLATLFWRRDSLRKSSLPIPLRVNALLAWLNDKPWEELIFYYKFLNLNLREAELLGYLPNCIKFERFFDQNGPGISTINLYANEISRRNDYDLYRKQGKLYALLHFRFTADTTYEQFCEKNILPTEQQFENYSHMIRAVRYDQQWFLKKSIRGRFDENEQFFNRICKWYASHGHWKWNKVLFTSNLK